MRQNKRWLKTIYLKPWIKVKDNEGSIRGDYPNEATELKANVQPAGGKVMSEIYGEKLAYMKTMYYDGELELKEKDGLCIEVPPTAKPDYRIVAIKPWNKHKIIDLEKVM